MPQLMRTSNPALTGQAFRGEHAAFGEQAMTVKGTVNKTGILLLCAVATAAWTWNIFLHTHTAEAVGPLALIGVIGGLIFAVATIFKKTWSPITAPLYALCEGLVLGSVSAILELRFPGIAIEAVSLTFGTLVCLLLAYRSGLIRVTDKFRLGVVAATGGIALFYVIEMVLGFFHIHFLAVNGAGAMASASAFLWSSSLHSTWSSILISSKAPRVRVSRSTWNGMEPLGCWLHWSGSISKFCSSFQNCVVATNELLTGAQRKWKHFRCAVGFLPAPPYLESEFFRNADCSAPAYRQFGRHLPVSLDCWLHLSA